MAIFNAIHSGETELVAIAVAGGAKGAIERERFTPCGVCRQVMAEFAKGDFKIILGENDVFTLDELLPYGFDKEKTGAKISELSGQFNLGEVLKRKAGKLSGGWQRRVSIAMALISEPAILFLDEPTLGLDIIARHDLWDVIRSLKGKITIILTTHYMEEAEELSDRIGIMKSGQLLAVGTVDELNAKAGTDDFEKAFVTIVKEG